MALDSNTYLLEHSQNMVYYPIHILTFGHIDQSFCIDKDMSLKYTIIYLELWLQANLSHCLNKPQSRLAKANANLVLPTNYLPNLTITQPTHLVLLSNIPPSLNITQIYPLIITNLPTQISLTRQPILAQQNYLAQPKPSYLDRQLAMLVQQVGRQGSQTLLMLLRYHDHEFLK